MTKGNEKLRSITNCYTQQKGRKGEGRRKGRRKRREERDGREKVRKRREENDTRKRKRKKEDEIHKIIKTFHNEPNQSKKANKN